METYEEKFGCSSLLIDTFLDLMSLVFGINAYKRREEMLEAALCVIMDYPISLVDLTEHLDHARHTYAVLGIIHERHSALLPHWRDYLECTGKLAQRGGVI